MAARVTPARARGVLRSWAATGLVEFGPQLELIQGVVPHGLERVGQGAQAVRPGAVQPLAARGPDGDEAGAREGVEVLRDGAEGDIAQGAVDVAGRAFLAPHEPQDFAAAGSGEGGERPGHDR